MRAPGAADALLEALDDRSPQVRSAAAVALARLRDVRAIRPTLAMLIGHDAGLSVAAGEALMTFGPTAVPDLVRVLADRSEDGDEDAQVRILEVLANIGDGASLDAITRAAQPIPPMTHASDAEERERMARRRRAEPRVRAWALWGLGRLGRAESLPVLEKGSLDSDPDVGEAAEAGLRPGRRTARCWFAWSSATLTERVRGRPNRTGRPWCRRWADPKPRPPFSN
jgi:HEAT repeat protein